VEPRAWRLSWASSNPGGVLRSAHDAESRAKLREFRGNDDTTPNKGLRGGEGQLFRGPDPLLAQKRWFHSRIGDMAKSLSPLREAKAQVDGNPVLSRTIDVVKVGEHGSDWAIRDFDPSSVELKAAGDPTGKTYIGDDRFIVVELSPTRAELERFAMAG
jgi:hypothetical protein